MLAGHAVMTLCRYLMVQADKLPFDQHWFLALAAPRPFIALEDETDTISLPEIGKEAC
jgi:hypothetical protein